MKNSNLRGFGTLAIHSCDEFNDTHAHVLPIYQTSTYSFDDVEHGQTLWRGEEQGYIYGRLGNPNTDATAATIAALEGKNLPERPYALMAASGMAAVSTIILALLSEGDTIVSQNALYGASFTLFHKQMPRFGIKHEVFTSTNLAELETQLEKSTHVRVVYIESPANPTMTLTDIRGVVERAHQVGAYVVIDNTFATPYLQRPLEMGVDVVLHSTTKYLTGHGTVVGGAIITPHKALYDKMVPILTQFGGVQGPHDAWLTGLGIKTLHVRMPVHCSNAMQVAQFLESHPAVEKVYYPGLSSFEQYELARAQMDDFGGMMAFELKGGYEAGEALMNHVQLCTLAVSLGSVDSLIQHPASMTHFKNTPEERAQMGIGEGLIRFSVGIENIEDIIGDLEQALAKVPVAEKSFAV